MLIRWSIIAVWEISISIEIRRKDNIIFTKIRKIQQNNAHFALFNAYTCRSYFGINLFKRIRRYFDGGEFKRYYYVNFYVNLAGTILVISEYE